MRCRAARIAAICLAFASTCVWAQSARAQTGDAPADRPRFEAGLQLAVARSGEFDAGDSGVGGRLGFRPVAPVGIEAEVTVYPGAFPGRRPFSRARIEGLFGVTVGPTLGRVRPFARARPGFLVIRQSSEPVACILIFPPPLACVLAGGRTVPAIDLGGGLEVSATSRALVRVDVGDRLLRYPAPAFDSDRSIQQRPFVGHDVRVAFGAVLRF